MLDKMLLSQKQLLFILLSLTLIEHFVFLKCQTIYFGKLDKLKNTQKVSVSLSPSPEQPHLITWHVRRVRVCACAHAVYRHGMISRVHVCVVMWAPLCIVMYLCASMWVLLCVRTTRAHTFK